MRFTIIAASLVAAVAAQYGAGDETCSAMVTVTVTETLGQTHTPIAPSASSGFYYPTTAVVPSGGVAMPTDSGSPLVPEASSVEVPVGGGAGYPTGAPVASGTAAPSGTGAASAPYPEFTGAASSLKMGGALAGVGAFLAMML